MYLREAFLSPWFLPSTLMTSLSFTCTARRWFMLTISHSWIGECKLRRYCWRLMKLLTPQKTGFVLISLSWTMQKHNSSSCPWDATSRRASCSLLDCWDFGLTPGLTEMPCCSGMHKIVKDHTVIHLLKKLGLAITADHLLNIYHAFPADAWMLALPAKKQNMIALSRERVTKACVFMF